MIILIYLIIRIMHVFCTGSDYVAKEKFLLAMVRWTINVFYSFTYLFKYLFIYYWSATADEKSGSASIAHR